MASILMINPPALVTSVWQVIQYPEPYPYGLLKLATLLGKRGHRVELIDLMEYRHHEAAFLRSFPRNLVPHSIKHAGSRNVSDRPRQVYDLGRPPSALAAGLADRPPPDEVWVTCCLTFNFEPAHEVIRVVRKAWPGVKVRLGGMYPTLLPRLAAQSGADEVHEGKVEEAEAEFGDYSLYPTPPEVGLYNFATGCSNRCSFCVNHRFTPTLRTGPEAVVEYLAGLRHRLGIRHFSNWDPNVMLHLPELSRFLDLIAQRGLDCSLSFDMGIQSNKLSADLARRMRLANVTQVTVPFETTDPAMLRRFRKPHGVEAPLKAFAALREAGFDLTRLHSCALFALDGEDPRHLFRTYFTIVGNGVRPIFSPYSPVPTSQEWSRIAHLIDGKPADELNGYLFPTIDSSEQVDLYERLIELFHTFDVRSAERLAAGLPAEMERLFHEEHERARARMREEGREFHVPDGDPAPEPWNVEAPPAGGGRAGRSDSRRAPTGTRYDLLLCVPPANDEQVMPELGPAQLAGWLGARGAGVLQVDLNLVFLKAFFERTQTAWTPKPGVADIHRLADRSISGVVEAGARPHPLWDRFLDRALLSRWRGGPPSVVGLSILCADQVLPALRLGTLVRERWGDVPVVWGGPFANSGRPCRRALRARPAITPGVRAPRDAQLGGGP